MEYLGIQYNLKCHGHPALPGALYAIMIRDQDAIVIHDARHLFDIFACHQSVTSSKSLLMINATQGSSWNACVKIQNLLFCIVFGPISKIAEQAALLWNIERLLKFNFAGLVFDWNEIRCNVWLILFCKITMASENYIKTVTFGWLIRTSYLCLTDIKTVNNWVIQSQSVRGHHKTMQDHPAKN